MKILSKILIFFAFAYVLLVMHSLALSSELIEPTRTLEPTDEKLGNLSVFSEPPGLEVAIDGIKIGKTPAFLDQVKPGSHRLRVKSSETNITIEPGKTLQISLYKDEFIVMPTTDKKPPKQPDAVETNLPKAKSTPHPAEELRPNELSPIERFRLLGHY